MGIDPVDYAKMSGMDFTSGNAQDAFSALATDGRNAIVNGILATPLGLKVGDIIPLATPTGQQNYRIVAIGSDVLSMKINTVYISQMNMRLDFNKSEDILYQVNLAKGADAATAEQWLNQIVADYPQFRLIAGHTYLSEFAQQYESIISGFYVLLAVLAFPSLIAILNTLAIGVIERTREIGMLRAIGATRGQVRKSIVLEALLLAALGTALGSPGGVVSQLRIRRGHERGRIHEDGVRLPAGWRARSHCGGLALWRARRDRARAPGIEHADHQSAAVRVIAVSGLLAEEGVVSEPM